MIEYTKEEETALDNMIDLVVTSFNEPEDKEIQKDADTVIRLRNKLKVNS